MAVRRQDGAFANEYAVPEQTASSAPLADVDEPARDRGSGRHGR
jgi:hypothetical protein